MSDDPSPLLPFKISSHPPPIARCRYVVAGQVFAQERPLELSVMPQQLTLQRLREVGERLGRRYPGATKMGLGWGKVRPPHSGVCSEHAVVVAAE